LESKVGASLVGGGRVFYRDGTGAVQSASRGDVPGLSTSGAITKDTVVFDTSLTDLGAFRSGFEKRAKEMNLAVDTAREPAHLVEVVSYATTLVMNYLTRGRFTEK